MIRNIVRQFFFANESWRSEIGDFDHFFPAFVLVLVLVVFYWNVELDVVNEKVEYFKVAIGEDERFRLQSLDD